jgi:prevent-host-death family protein
MTTITSREFNQRTDAAKRAARSGPVIVTRRGAPEHVLLTYADFVKMGGSRGSLGALFKALPDTSGVELPAVRSAEGPRAAEFD